MPPEISVGIVFTKRPATGRVVAAGTAGTRPRDSPLPETEIQKGIRALERRGFRVTGRSASTLSVRASPSLFEKAFGARLTRRDLPTRHGSKGCFVVEPVPGEIPVIPRELLGIVAIVQIQPPNEYLTSGGGATPATVPASGAPKAKPPKMRRYHLDVLKDVRRLLKADKVHAKGVTGNGVRVAMIDSGFDHLHPFFVANGFKSERHLAVPTMGYSKDIDTMGHGTGESANLFSVAPRAEFVGIKIGGDAPGDAEATLLEGFHAAMKLQPLPKIISCSVMLSDKPWNALAEAVLDAYNAGIAVVVCAGNGQFGFPAQMPQVIAAGGVYVAKNGSRRASSAASAFVSTAYPGRNVPDCCGLVGQLPRAAYIMLPVSPGSTYDQDFADPDANGAPGDGTKEDDGWALFSGTSAAAPQLAGVCALLLEKKPKLTPDQLKKILVNSCTAVKTGSTNPATGGLKASSAQPNTATGSGLANAFAAWQAA